MWVLKIRKTRTDWQTDKMIFVHNEHMGWLAGWSDHYTSSVWYWLFQNYHGNTIFVGCHGTWCSPNCVQVRVKKLQVSSLTRCNTCGNPAFDQPSSDLLHLVGITFILSLWNLHFILVGNPHYNDEHCTALVDTELFTGENYSIYWCELFYGWKLYYW